MNTKISGKATRAFGLLVLLLMLSGLYAHKWWKHLRQGGDGMGYYVYLPALFIHKDLGDYTATSAALRKYQPGMAELKADIYGFRETPTGKTANKYPIGPGILQAPFFLLAHLYAHLDTRFEQDGFSRPYQIASFASTILYVSIGLWLLFSTLLLYFNSRISLLTIYIIALGTNLLFFTSFSNAMAHGYQFWAVSMLVYFSARFYRRMDVGTAILLGVSLGWVGIIRPQDLIFGLVPALWGVYNIPTLKQRLTFVWRERALILWALAGFALMAFPQLYYYKWVSGQWFYYSYVGETFNWLNPKIYKGLMDYKNGWLRYTPVMWFALAGMVLYWKKQTDWVVPLVYCLILHIYISYSWWCWQYIAGLGSRPMVDLYPLLAFGLAAFITWAYSQHSAVKVLSGLGIALFSLLSLKFIYQQYNGHIFSEVNNKGYYNAMLFKIKPQMRDIAAFNTNYVQPDTSGLVFREMIFADDFEGRRDYTDSTFFSSGRQSVNMNSEFVSLARIEGHQFEMKKGDWLRVRMKVYLNQSGISATNLAKFVLAFKRDANDNTTPWNDAQPTALGGNQDPSIWHAGAVGQWESVEYFTRVPFHASATSHMEILGFNPARQSWFIDDLQVEWWQAK